jgi:cyclohexanone monooxygenase
MTKAEQALSADALGFDPEQLAERYRIERSRRLRDDAESQFVQVGEDSPFTNSFLTNDPYSELIERDPIKDVREVIVIGGGWVGLMTASRLIQAGVTDMLIVESGADFGGTWYWNRYPGAQCDIESYSYLPLLEETGYIPKLRYSYAPEIFKHAQRIGRHFNLYKDAVFQTSVTELRWDADAGFWVVSTNRGDEMRARYVCLGTGPANRPRLPGIPGVETFKGHSFHTCRWDYDYTDGGPEGNLTGLANKKVAIIGTGATAIQCVPPLGASAEQLYVFQRTPSSVDRRNNSATDPDWAAGLETGWQAVRQRQFVESMTGGVVHPGFEEDGWTRMTRNVLALMAQAGDLTPDQLGELAQLADFKTMEEIRSRVDQTVEDPRVAEKLKAYYNQFCKRPTFHDDYLETFNRSNVELVDVSETKGVEQITERGLVANGKEYEVDCIIYASGFEITSSYQRRIGVPIFGIDGESIYDHWEDGMRTMHGLMAHGFPNMFFCGGVFVFQLGPNYCYGVDIHARHVAYTLNELLNRKVQVAQPSKEAVRRWMDDQLSDEASQALLVLGGSPASCTPGYYNQEGAQDRYRDVRLETYGKGLEAYSKILDDWRNAGELDGLDCL